MGIGSSGELFKKKKITERRRRVYSYIFLFCVTVMTVLDKFTFFSLDT
jgi:hypothetical protein